VDQVERAFGGRVEGHIVGAHLDVGAPGPGAAAHVTHRCRWPGRARRARPGRPATTTEVPPAPPPSSASRGQAEVRSMWRKVDGSKSSVKAAKRAIGLGGVGSRR
jgi:hypothetical protein